MNATFEYVEDYIEFIAGLRSVAGKPLGLFDQVPSPISLARYDVNIVHSLAEQTQQQRAYTDKQAALAVKIVDKYRKQLSKLSQPVYVSEKLDNFKLGVREVDRSRRAMVVDGRIHLRFPFDTKMIDNIKDFARTSQGSCTWDNSARAWSIAITEYNINWVYVTASQHQFEIDPQIVQWFSLICESENTNFAIELVKTSTGYEITNAPESLNTFVVDRLGPQAWTNIRGLVDLAPVAGYSVSAEVIDAAELTDTEKDLFLNRVIKIKSTNQEQLIQDVLMPYAKQVNRLPIRIYSPGVPKKSTDEFFYLNGSTKIDHNQAIPLLFSTNGIMIGNKKQAWLQNAEKIIIIE